MRPDTLPVAAAVPAQPVAAGSSFYLAMRILSACQRQAMFCIYGFCRAVDDIADGDAPCEEKREGLEAWRRAIDACYAHGAPVPALPELGRHIDAYGLAREDFDAVIDGMLMDACGQGICAPDEATLDLYCDRVASAVGRLSVKVFGMPGEDGAGLAHHLGRALQLTNILRDIDEDAALGRMYLPREALERAGVALGPAAGIAAHPRLAGACDSVAALADFYYGEAEAIMHRASSHAARAPRIMGAAYRALLTRLRLRGWDHPRAPVKVPKLQRAGILLRYALF
jgi:phytoene synthase